VDKHIQSYYMTNQCKLFLLYAREFLCLYLSRYCITGETGQWVVPIDGNGGVGGAVQQGWEPS